MTKRVLIQLNSVELYKLMLIKFLIQIGNTHTTPLIPNIDFNKKFIHQKNKIFQNL